MHATEVATIQHVLLQDVKQFYIFRFLLGSAEVSANYMSAAAGCPFISLLLFVLLAAVAQHAGPPHMIVCFQGGTMPGMWYTLSLYLSGACQTMQMPLEVS